MKRAMCVLLLLGACRRGVPLADVSFDAGRVVIRAEVADDPAARARGLMFRTSLARGRGMLFLFDGVASVPFTMENTLIPLDLVSIRAGRVVGIQHMQPCPGPPCPHTRTPPIDAALEIGAGEAARQGIGVGMLVEAPGLP